MDTTVKSKEETQALHDRGGSRFPMLSLGSLLTAACFMLSLSSIAISFLTSFKTSQLEHRVRALEMEEISVLHPSASVLTGEGGVPALRDTIEKMLQERIAQAIPKLRATREVNQECSCPPGLNAFRKDGVEKFIMVWSVRNI
ncbi:hypothetical protein AAFF_G00149090 [Aldrovandia affinis]|uniref:Uncharacterized protein n=1 Tax=Aldrovandia affinis TaxID=143900 RepID=A0AAD7RPA4_9TELE|nr:hypothetical protein AAFF_G00149090 [Aldrovandia affinis]